VVFKTLVADTAFKHRYHWYVGVTLGKAFHTVEVLYANSCPTAAVPVTVRAGVATVGGAETGSGESSEKAVVAP
jgi:hypothetical protein